jgi:hypothetical protein
MNAIFYSTLFVPADVVRSPRSFRARTGAPRLRRRARGPIDLQPQRAADAVGREQKVRRTEQVVDDGRLDAIPVGSDDAPGVPVRSRSHPVIAVEMPHRARSMVVHERTIRDEIDGR